MKHYLKLVIRNRPSNVGSDNFPGRLIAHELHAVDVDSVKWKATGRELLTVLFTRAEEARRKNKLAAVASDNPEAFAPWLRGTEFVETIGAM